MTNRVIAPGVRKNTSADGVAIDSTGVKLSYTAPSGKRAEIASWFCFDQSATYVLDSEIVIGAATITLERGTAGAAVQNRSTRVMMASGDVFQLRVSTAGAATETADMFIGILEEA